MSRIVLRRHSNGEEALVVGWDRPLRSAFVDAYDDEGECTSTRGPIAGETLSVSDVVRILRHDARLDELTVAEVEARLARHALLDYPDSNVRVDLTRGGWR